MPDHTEDDRERRRLLESHAALAEWEAEAGPVTAEERAAVDELWAEATDRLATSDTAGDRPRRSGARLPAQPGAAESTGL